MAVPPGSDSMIASVAEPVAVIPPSVKTFCWGNNSSPESDASIFVSLDDVMKEQKDSNSEGSPVASGGSLPSNDSPLDQTQDTTSDEILARLLQSEFDDEFQRMDKQAGSPPTKFTVGFDPFDRPLVNDSGEEDEDPNASWDNFEEKTGITLGNKGFARERGPQGKVLSTKHDATLCGRRNACRVMEFKSEIETGDGGAFDMKLNNHVYNALKVHSHSEAKRAARLHEKKEKSTAESAMDATSRLLIFKLINQGILDEVNGAINTGKEAVVYHGIGGNIDKQITSGEVAIKVYKTTLNEFRNREPYIKEDYRFKDKFSKANNRKIIPLWAEKEMHNLNRILRAGIPCPQVVCLMKHVLVMTFIGVDGRSAPILKDAVLNDSQVNKAYADSVNIMKVMYTNCGLIHADLSEFNLLWHQNKVWVIDVSQSVIPTHPNALGFLLRDCINVTNVSISLVISRVYCF